MILRVVILLFSALVVAACPRLTASAPNCTDGRLNGNETDVDCGGSACPNCADGKVCLVDGDCSSLTCTLSRCTGPSCIDGVRNNDETDVDCGGSCAPCEVEQACRVAADCLSGSCADAGVCAGASCSNGVRDGAETDVDCGGTACGPCAANGACVRNADCVAGVCANGLCGDPCPAPLLACNNACVVPAVDRTNCGTCGVTCQANELCIAGQCTVQCLGGSTLCGGTCVDTNSNPAHCGGCNLPCPTGESCFQGVCTLICPIGYVPCNGACVDTMRDSLHCGTCTTQCGSGSACVGGQCSIGCTSPLQSCNAGLTCVDPRNDPGNCGGCTNACPALPHAMTGCADGGCVLGACQPGFDNCNSLTPDGCEAQLATDLLHCGACGAACPPLPNAAPTCFDGGCGIAACFPGFDNCNTLAPDGCEIDLRSDPAHCGGCTTSCPTPPNAAPGCFDGGCGLGGCLPGFDNCNGNGPDGCEVNLKTNTANCGACNNACGNPPNAIGGCFDGGCGIAGCTSFFRGDCNGVVADGCETILVTDNNNCGFCGNVCAMGETCSGAGCCGTPPPGAYSSTCTGCTFCNGLLQCLCNFMMMSFPSSIEPSTCTTDVLNCSGVLTCDAC